MIVPACSIAPPASGETACVIAEPNVDEAIAAPADEEAVAPAMIMPDIGASRNAGILTAVRIPVISVWSWDVLMIPEMVPVPISKIATGIILFNP